MIHVETRQDLAITNEETLDKSADSALDRRRCLSPTRNPSPLERRHRWPSNFFQDQVHRTVERRRSFSVDGDAYTTTSPLAAGDAGAALGRGHRHPPLSRTTVPPPLPSHFPLPRALALPCYRVCDPAREISQFRRLTRFQSFLDEPCFLFRRWIIILLLEESYKQYSIRYIFRVTYKSWIIIIFFLSRRFLFFFFHLDKHRGNLEILFININIFT